MASIPFAHLLKLYIVLSNRAGYLILLSNDMFLIPGNNLKLLIYSYVVEHCLKIQYGCQICGIVFPSAVNYVSK